MQDVIVGIPASRQMARRFVAGETLDDAIVAICTTNANRMLATLDFLGEHVHTEAEASVNADEYIQALQAIARTGVNSNVSIKLTAMGWAIYERSLLSECTAHRGSRAPIWAILCALTWKIRR